MSNKQILAVLAVLIILGAIFGFWAMQTRQAGAPAQETHLLAGTIDPETQDYVYSESTDIYEIKAAWPSKVPLPAAEASAKAGLALEQMIKAQIDQFKADGNFANLTEEDKQIQGLDGTRKYALALEYKDYDAPGYHSYFYTVYEDTLGAHPNGFFVTYAFDAQGNPVALGDLLGNNPNWLEELSLLVSNDVTKQMQARTGQSDVSGLLFAEGLAPQETNFQNFVIDGDTLMIEIPPYQVAAYATGSFEVRIPLSDINK